MTLCFNAPKYIVIPAFPCPSPKRSLTRFVSVKRFHCAASINQLTEEHHMLKWVILIIAVVGVSILIIWCVAQVIAWKSASSATMQTKVHTQIVDKLKSIRELHTGVAVVQTIVTNSQGKRVLGMEIAATKLLYVAVGQVRAGIDLAQLNADSIQRRNDHVFIRLPPVQILDAKIDVENSYVYDVRRSLVLAPDAFDLQSDAQRKALDEITATAIRCGILDMASEQSKNVIAALMQMLGVVDVQIEVESVNQESQAA